MKAILITGGAGFVGSNLAILFKEKFPEYKIICLDNLKRRGSELNLPRLKKNGIEFVHGDIRNREDLFSLPKIDLILECSAEPSVLAGRDGSPDYLLNTNLFGTVNCLEFARRDKSDMIFLSTSRVYPIAAINSLNFTETETRFELTDNQKISGASSKGYTEEFPLKGARSLYGTTKLASELLIEEYRDTFGIKTIINRCGVLTGPWQMGKVDQGVITFWVAAHIFGNTLKYFGYGGQGKQVRDILHVKDLFALLLLQIEKIDSLSGEVFNVGGGREVSVSLAELTKHCEAVTGKKISITSVIQDRDADIRIYMTDNTRVTQVTGWKPTILPREIISDIANWIENNKLELQPILT